MEEDVARHRVDASVSPHQVGRYLDRDAHVIKLVSDSDRRLQDPVNFEAVERP